MLAGIRPRARTPRPAPGMSCTVIRSEEGGITIREILKNLGARAQRANADLPGINGNFAKETGRKCISVLFGNLPFGFVLH